MEPLEIIAIATMGLFGVAFAIRATLHVWELIYGLAPVVVPIALLVLLYAVIT